MTGVSKNTADDARCDSALLASRATALRRVAHVRELPPLPRARSAELVSRCSAFQRASEVEGSRTMRRVVANTPHFCAHVRLPDRSACGGAWDPVAVRSRDP